jgi:endonuclease YncB( thermonuclease family)
MKLALPVAASLLLCLSATAVLAEAITARVAHVVDGDTLDVLLQGKRLRVRLVDIDAPEQKQPDGLRSRQSLIQICAGEIATLESRGRDRNGRMLAHVVCDTTDANAEQVRRGMAWVFERYAAPDSPLYRVQNEARAARRGLWSEAAPIAPWQWRRLGHSERAERRLSDTTPEH